MEEQGEGRAACGIEKNKEGKKRRRRINKGKRRKKRRWRMQKRKRNEK